ncbi:alpha/beta hydrolase [Sulfoacidibacillus thermotolerans]|uniref:Esterase n=1 Tax=Sulfoacidibacillus thermotolerans TaxID=1765684 RepID=A0A2U3DB40_SULT2|nr:alpha/beta hydrolase-fold protein [Sulfoacidibacillus thermotolerans]PWI58490.1 hypothetical protein BM613_02915 [Sulfoacidibacillus thermotolerans]
MDTPKRRIIGHTLYSAHLEEERTVKIFLPPDYDENKSYPILYCHDGNEFFSHGRIATFAADLIAQGKLKPFLIAGIAVNHERRADDYALFGQRNDAYTRFVIEECIPFVEQSYAIHKERFYRAMAGISLGAVVTLELVFANPQLFEQLILFSGAFYQEVLTYVNRIPLTHKMSAYMIVGEQEQDVETPSGHYNFLQANREMKALLEDKALQITYQEKTGTHIWGFWQKYIPEVLMWLHQKWHFEEV